jgi:hypothetical protein
MEQPAVDGVAPLRLVPSDLERCVKQIRHFSWVADMRLTILWTASVSHPRLDKFQPLFHAEDAQQIQNPPTTKYPMVAGKSSANDQIVPTKATPSAWGGFFSFRS